LATVGLLIQAILSFPSSAALPWFNRVMGITNFYHLCGILYGLAVCCIGLVTTYTHTLVIMAVCGLALPPIFTSSYILVEVYASEADEEEEEDESDEEEEEEGEIDSDTEVEGQRQHEGPHAEGNTTRASSSPGVPSSSSASTQQSQHPHHPPVEQHHSAEQLLSPKSAFVPPRKSSSRRGSHLRTTSQQQQQQPEGRRGSNAARSPTPSPSPLPPTSAHGNGNSGEVSPTVDGSEFTAATLEAKRGTITALLSVDRLDSKCAPWTRTHGAANARTP
jgi:hypothetical protein